MYVDIFKNCANKVKNVMEPLRDMVMEKKGSTRKLRGKINHLLFIISMLLCSPEKHISACT